MAVQLPQYTRELPLERIASVPHSASRLQHFQCLAICCRDPGRIGTARYDEVGVCLTVYMKDWVHIRSPVTSTQLSFPSIALLNALFAFPLSDAHGAAERVLQSSHDGRHRIPRCSCGREQGLYQKHMSCHRVSLRISTKPRLGHIFPGPFHNIWRDLCMARMEDSNMVLHWCHGDRIPIRTHGLRREVAALERPLQ